MAFDALSVSVIVGYLVLSTLAGALLARRSSSSSQWSVAGGQMGILMVAVGIAGTRIGGVGTYGVAGDVIQTGLWNLWYGINTFLALALVGLFFALPYRRLKLRTVGEIFRLRFGNGRSQVLTSLCVQTEYLIVNILEPFVIGSILVGVTGMPMWVAVYIGAGVLILYTALGGLWGSAVTNLIHCIVMIVGLGLVLVVGISHFGGWQGVVDKVDLALADKAQDAASWWSWSGAGWMAIVAMFFSAAIHTPAASIYVNFSSACRKESQVKPAFLWAGLIAAAMPFLAGSIGILTLAEYGAETGSSGYALITRLATQLSPIVGGVALAAVLAAVISSGGPILLSSSTMLVNDWMPFTQKLTSRQRLVAYRVTTAVYGLFAATIAWRGSIGSILDLLLLGFAMVVPPAIAVGYLIYWKRTTEKAAFWGILVGYGVGLTWYGLIHWAGWVGFEAGPDAGALRRLFHWLFVFEGDGIDPSYVTTLVPLVAIPLISWMTPEDEKGKDEFYAILAGEKERVVED